MIGWNLCVCLFFREPFLSGIFSKTALSHELHGGVSANGINTELFTCRLTLAIGTRSIPMCVFDSNSRPKNEGEGFWGSLLFIWYGLVSCLWVGRALCLGIYTDPKMIALVPVPVGVT